MKRVIFACVHNAGRSQMAAAFFNAVADPARAQAISAGTTPAPRVHPEVVEVMRESGIDLSGASPQKLTASLAQGSALLVTLGCGDQCPLIPGLRRDDWPLEDPQGQALDTVRKIRDQVRRRVEQLVLTEGWSANTACAIERPRAVEPMPTTAVALVITAAHSEDAPAIAAVLRRAQLHVEADGLRTADFLVARSGGRIDGAVALEAHGRTGLLRSLAVEPSMQRHGIGDQLVDRALKRAREIDLDSVWLLTTSAAGFFSRWGFRELPRDAAPAELRHHPQFRVLCPSSAKCMRRKLAPLAHAYPRGMLPLVSDVPGARYFAVALEHAELTWYEVDPGTHFERHVHDVDQITLVLEGELRFEVDDRPPIRLGPGEVVALPRGVPHAVTAGLTPVRAVDAWSRDARSSRAASGRSS